MVRSLVFRAGLRASAPQSRSLNASFIAGTRLSYISTSLEEILTCSKLRNLCNHLIVVMSSFEINVNRQEKGTIMSQVIKDIFDHVLKLFNGNREKLSKC